MSKCSTLLSLAALVAFFTARPLFASEDDDTIYRNLVRRVQSGDFAVDFQALRMACMKSTLCQPRSSKADLVLLNRADNAHDSAKMIEICERLLDQGFVNIEVHATLAKAYQDTQETKKSKFHLDVVTALLRSIRESGDGKTMETAYQVICDREEYDTLTSLGLRYFGPMVSETAVHEHGHAYDRFEMTNSVDGQSRIIFFNVDAFSEKSRADTR
jgi:hypothetical protein